ncbi:MAG: succinylglutamate desuccinylase/aspartoacylase family protein [Acidiferrobacterales bacterium]|nr:succinylglutamate desuccinylase/aspartoacylase family protein [Acidiferrobacterales bacterium]
MTNNNIQSPVEVEFDLDADGWHQGFARVPHSVHRSAYGFIPVPIISIKNGTGPVALLMGGNHGDEYEGQVALNNLARRLTPKDIRGQLIIMPMANYPAAVSGLRTSPIDQGNLNRTFPGNPSGTPTEVIAHFIESELLSRSDFLLDIHSGGSSLYYHPTAMLAKSQDSAQQQRRIELLNAVGLPKSLIYHSDLRAGYSSSAAARQGAIGMTLEIGGAGRITPQFLGQLEDCLSRYLQHIGICIDSEYVSKVATKLFEMPSSAYYVYARSSGLFEPKVSIDQEVDTGQLAGWIHHPEDVNWEPEKIQFRQQGVVIAVRVPAKVEPGDCLIETASEI